MLYEWVNKNHKFAPSNEIKNYVRGLFDNYFPRIYDFIDTNRSLAFDFTEVFVFKNIIALYDVSISFTILLSRYCHTLITMKIS